MMGRIDIQQDRFRLHGAAGILCMLTALSVAAPKAATSSGSGEQIELAVGTTESAPIMATPVPTPDSNSTGSAATSDTLTPLRTDSEAAGSAAKMLPPP